MDGMNPLVSIIIPTYNRADLIIETLESVKSQTYNNWECIVVDDEYGSGDETEQIVNDIIKSDNRISYYKRNREPKGAPTCRNIGFDQSKGKYIIFLDSDDLMADFCIERRIKYFEQNPGEDFHVYQTVLFSKKREGQNLFWNIDTRENDLQRFLRIDALWSICGPIYKRDVIMKLKGFREGLGFWQDYDLHLRVLLLKFSYRKFLNIEPDIFIRQGNRKSLSSSITWISDKDILQKRIDFFFNQIKFIGTNNIRLNEEQKFSIWNTISVFIFYFLAEHKNRMLYRENWNRLKRLFPYKWKHYFFTNLYAYIYFYTRKSVHTLWINNYFLRVFRNYIMDTKVFSKGTAGKILYNKS